MANSSNWANTLSNATSDYDLYGFDFETVGGGLPHWESGAAPSISAHEGASISPFSLAHHDQTSNAHLISGMQATYQLSTQNHQRQYPFDVTTTVPRYIRSASLDLHYSQSSPTMPGAAGNTELTCLDCPNRTFNRKADKDRHDREQHRCPHLNCKDSWFSAHELRLHMASHGNLNIYFTCGTCDLVGRSKCTFKRLEKLKNHFASLHRVRTTHSTFQCFEPACYDEGLEGGIFFVSQEDHVQHLLIEHNIGEPDLPAKENTSSSEEISSSQGSLRQHSEEGPERSKLQNEMEETSLEHTDHDGQAMQVMRPRHRAMAIENSTQMGLEGNSEGLQVGRVIDNDDNIIGVLVDWDQSDPIFMSITGGTAVHRRRIQPNRRRLISSLVGGKQAAQASRGSASGGQRKARAKTQTR